MVRFEAGYLAILSLSLVVGCKHQGATSESKKTVDRGPTIIEIEGAPNGLWWDASSSALFIADGSGNRILRWTDEGGVSLLAALPPAPEAGAGLGQLVRMQDGTLVVTRFGFGTAGDVVYVDPSNQAHVVPRLAPERRRIGLTISSEGRLFEAWFVAANEGRIGAISELSLDGTETEVVADLKKPVGVLASGDALFISDQDLGQVLRAPIGSPSSFVVHARMEAPDLLAAGKRGVIFAGSAKGSVFRIAEDGSTSVIRSGFQQVRGVAYDAENGRLFVVDHHPHQGDGAKQSIHVLPSTDVRRFALSGKHDHV